MKYVRTYSFATRKVVEIPEEELAPEMLRVSVDGVGDVYMNTRELKPGTEVRHPLFPEETVRLIQQIGDDLAEVLPQQCKDNWVDGFRYDRNPDREIAIWRRIADVYLVATRSRPMNLPMKQECFRVLMNCTSAEASTVLQITPLAFLTRNEAARIVDAYFALSRNVPIDLTSGSGKTHRPDISKNDESNSAPMRKENNHDQATGHRTVEGDGAHHMSPLRA